MKYSEVREYNKPVVREAMVNDVCISFLLNYISPIFTKYFLKTKITPNQLTLGMISSGIIGAILFCIPILGVKIVGIFFIWFWFILDHCDGEVARISKQFSKFGKEIDYCAHVINHPLFAFSYLVTILQFTNDYRYAVLFFIVISMNLAYRFLNCMNFLYQIKMADGATSSSNENTMGMLKRLVIFFVNLFVHFPNYALIFPIICLINYKIAIVYTCVVAAVNIVYIPYIFLEFLMRIKKL